MDCSYCTEVQVPMYMYLNPCLLMSNITDPKLIHKQVWSRANFYLLNFPIHVFQYTYNHLQLVLLNIVQEDLALNLVIPVCGDINKYNVNRVFVMFWNMREISSTMVSVWLWLCVSLRIHLELINRVNAVSDNIIIIIIIINSAICHKERSVQCHVRSSLNQWCAIRTFQKHWYTVICRLPQLDML